MEKSIRSRSWGVRKPWIAVPILQLACSQPLRYPDRREFILLIAFIIPHFISQGSSIPHWFHLTPRVIVSFCPIALARYKKQWPLIAGVHQMPNKTRIWSQVIEEPVIAAGSHKLNPRSLSSRHLSMLIRSLHSVLL